MNWRVNLVEALRLFFHRPCPFCGTALLQGEKICADCWHENASAFCDLYPERCEKCGKLIYSCICHRTTLISQIIFPYFYQKKLVLLAHQLKEQKDNRFYLFIAQEMVTTLKQTTHKTFSGITYIPTTPSKEKARGFNPSKRLAMAVSLTLGIPLIDPPFTRQETDFSLHELSAKDREEQVYLLYLAGEGKISGDLLMVDDIVTTGSTLQRCAQLCLLAGATSITALCGFGTLKHGF